MEKIYKVKSTGRGFFRMYVAIMSIQNPISKLRRQEREVLAEVMYQNYTISKDYVNPEDPKKWRELFSYERKREMSEHSGNLSEASFANCLTALRKQGILDRDNYLHSALRVYPEKENVVSFKFLMQE